MFESEVNYISEVSDHIPAAVLQEFKSLSNVITHRTLLPWSEHCTECVWPTCYTTCSFYEPREDLKCRRFADGMVRIPLEGGPVGYLLKIKFKKWARLWAPGTLSLKTVEEAREKENQNLVIGALIRNLPVPRGLKKHVSLKRYASRNRSALAGIASAQKPDYFLVECYNPQTVPVSLALSVWPNDVAVSKIIFQHLSNLQPGYNRVIIPVADIEARVDLSVPFKIDIAPNTDEEGTELVFGLIDFVTDPAYRAKNAQAPATKEKKIKCVVWDLDNTVWDGVLIEDGLEKLVLKPGIKDIITELDARGILQAVCSKNNPDEAMQALRHFGFDEYILSPQISWGPKSAGIKAIAQNLNIGIDTLMFIDDSPFERSEVATACPAVSVTDAIEYLHILQKPELIVPVTEESRNRRKMYREQEARQMQHSSFGGDYFSFLKDCQLELTIKPLTEENLLRVHELTQRTNQMNFSGNIYSIDTLRNLPTDRYDSYVLTCQDRYGNYGTIGFSLVDRKEPRMIDLMFSCRIQSKRVEHAFITYLLKKYRTAEQPDFFVNYRKTDRNAPSGKVFEDFGFELTGENNGVLDLKFPAGKAIPDDGLITIVETKHETALP